MHKDGNFLKKLNRCGFTKNQRDQASRLFGQVAESDHKVAITLQSCICAVKLENQSRSVRAWN
jgi:hypothetical protein